MSRPSPYADEAPGGGLLARLYTRRSLHALGLLAIAVVVGLLAMSIAVFTHAFDDPARVRLEVDRAGSQLSAGADVKLHGIVVGRVDRIEPAPGGRGARLDLAIERGRLDLIPANVTAQVLPKTIFGEKYVDLGLPAEPAVARLADGAVIERDRSSVAIETSTVLNDLAPLLDAVSPAELNTTLTAIATAVQGRGELMGETISASRELTRGVRPTVPLVVTDAGLLAEVGDDYHAVADPLLRTFGQSGVTARTLTAHGRDLRRLLVSSRRFADVTRGFVDLVGETAIEVVEVSRPVLEMLQRYSPEIACLVRGVVKAKDRLEAVFADGPYLKARLYVSLSRGMYQPGIDDPKSLDLSAYGPYCPVTPEGGKGTVPWPEIPEELDRIRNQDGAGPLNSVDGLPGSPTAPLGDLLPMLLGGALG
ncbi:MULTISPECIES: MCE family protein [unclassified Nocardioides]|uniref:MCE family protein n=1 Tax=unclassified Nocardioides TaxID=2615069 RepID=UPI00361D7ADC